MSQKFQATKCENICEYLPKRAALVAACTFLWLWTQINPAFAWQTPLTQTETDRLSALALGELNLLTTRSSGSPNALVPEITKDADLQHEPIANSHPLGKQLLLLEVKEQKAKTPGAPRIAELFLFDYEIASTVLKLINVDTSEIISERTLPSAHLPLNEAEVSYSQSLVWDNVAVRAQVIEELQNGAAGMVQDRFGRPLLQSLLLPQESNSHHPHDRYDFSKLQTKVSIWVPGNGQNEAHNICHVQRCALISIFTDSNYNFSTEPVVNLVSTDIQTGLIK